MKDAKKESKKNRVIVPRQKPPNTYPCLENWRGMARLLRTVQCAPHAASTPGSLSFLSRNPTQQQIDKSLNYI
jgi:hypothetical protein